MGISVWEAVGGVGALILEVSDKAVGAAFIGTSFVGAAWVEIERKLSLWLEGLAVGAASAGGAWTIWSIGVSLTKAIDFLSWLIMGEILGLVVEGAVAGGAEASGASGAKLKGVGGAASFLTGFSLSGDEGELLFCGIAEADGPTGQDGGTWGLHPVSGIMLSCLCFAAICRFVRFMNGSRIAMKKLMLLQFATSSTVWLKLQVPFRRNLQLLPFLHICGPCGNLLIMNSFRRGKYWKYVYISRIRKLK